MYPETHLTLDAMVAELTEYYGATNLAFAIAGDDDATYLVADQIQVNAVEPRWTDDPNATVVVYVRPAEGYSRESIARLRDALTDLIDNGDWED